jgi:glyoxylase-like metal-dependent hydrolase (beta-lactamase superfamily II)
MTFGIIPVRDGAFSFAMSNFSVAMEHPTEAAELLGADAVPESIELPVWCYLVRTRESWGLVDVGGGALMGPGFGMLPSMLTRQGVDVSDVTQIWLTHLHGDHCGGLLSHEGDAVFPAARLAVPLREVDYWFSGTVPPALRPIAEDARRALEPYLSRLELVRPGETISGATALMASGHTPGHTAWLLAEHGALAAGDLVHVAALQCRRTQWSTDWDNDPSAAAQTRADLLAQAGRDHLALLTCHAGVLQVSKDAPEQTP